MKFQNEDYSIDIPECDVKDRTVSFKIPMFSNDFQENTPFDVIVYQEKRQIGQIKYHYRVPGLFLSSICHNSNPGFCLFF